MNNVKLILFLLFFLFLSNNSANAQLNKNILNTIVIDPGHGGKDSGTMGTKRYKKYEKHIALAVSLKLGEYISNEFPDIKVIYTRKTDIFLELNERTELANNSSADLFISIHCDGFTNSSPSGASVFVMGMSKLKANMDVAMRENSAIYMEDNYQQKYEGFDPKSQESYIVFSLMQNTFLNQSLKIAEEVEKEISTRANRKSRGVKQAPFYVISRTNMPSILIECGFLTNPKEEDYLHSEIGQDYIASAIFRAFRTYKKSVEIKDDIIIGNSEMIEDTTLKTEKITDKKDIIEKTNVKLLYKVQIGTYLKSMLNDQNFIDLKAEEHKINGTYRYYISSDNNKSNADTLKDRLRELGFNGAFIVAFLDGKQISTKEALTLQNKLYINE
ncbi:MAG: N-acetylmuramoyl-L-alanine amidase [Flavobacteriales bacterium]|nr:N-acetylmuramoyl-L-alanine amidase [Flavobacteriales bacterium]